MRDYGIENTATMSPPGDDEIEEAQDIKSLLALMTRTLSVVTESRSAGTTGSDHHPYSKVEDCPTKRKSTSLVAWIDEVLLWNETINGSSESIRAKKYLKFVDSVRKSEDCKDLQNLIEVDFVENQSFDKKGEDVIKTIVEKVKEKLGQSDIEKCSDAWLDFINVKQELDESAQSFITRFEKLETKLRNVKINIPNKALAIHLMTKSNMEQQSKENVLTKTNLNHETEIYTTMKKSIREMKGNLTRKESSDVAENKTYFTSPENESRSERPRSKSKFNHGDTRRRSKSRYSRRDGADSRRGYRDGRSFSRDRRHGSSYRDFRDHSNQGYKGGSYRRDRRSEKSRSGSRYYSNGAAKKTASEEVKVVHFSEYKDKYETDVMFIKDIINNADALDKDIIDIIYKEGNNVIDPYTGRFYRIKG